MAKKKDDCCAEMQFTDHSKELPRLNRIAGQVEGVKKMIEKRMYCTDILTQLRAVRSAVNSIEASILEAHLDACVTDAFKSGNKEHTAKKMNELKELYRRFNE
jgi:CsoR family transcriptional regulator, copper-sensing transcriptional repressor